MKVTRREENGARILAAQLSPLLSATVWAGCPSDPLGGEDCFGGDGVFTGGQYNPSTDSWRPIPARGAPGPRYSTKGIWTGSEMIAWGGLQTDSDTYTWTGGRYRPPQQ